MAILSDAAFRGRNETRTATIRFNGIAQGVGYTLENGFGQVVTIQAVENLNVQIAAQIVGKGAAELNGERKRHVGSVRRPLRSAELQKRAVGKIDDTAAQRLIHRDIGAAVATNASLIAQSFGNNFAQSDTRIFDCVVSIHLKISACIDDQIDKAMLGKEIEHVVKERMPGGDRGTSAAIQIDFEGNVRLSGCASVRCFSHGTNTF